MTQRTAKLDKIFKPRSIAIVGVSGKGFQFGGSSYLSRLEECGFEGSLYPINPKLSELSGREVFPSLEGLPEVPDLAIVCLAARRVPDVLEDCARVGCRHIHILSAGFKELGTGEGAELETRVAEISRRHGLMVVGPNCMGPYCPGSGLTPFGESPGLAGPVGLISQSGGITQRMTEYACSLGIGISKAVSFGNAAVLDGCDYLEYMAEDDETRVIAMYLESVRDGRRLLELAKEVNRAKPIVLLRGGESEVGQRAAASHTGAMAGGRETWDAFVRQTGVTRVRSLSEWMDAIAALSLLPAPTGRGVFLGCGGGGSSVIAGDVARSEGLDVPAPSDATMDAFREFVPAVGSFVGNPLDHLWMSFDAPQVGQVLDLVFEDPACAMILVDLLIPRKIYHAVEFKDPTPVIIEFLSGRPDRKPTVFSLDHDGGSADLAQTGTDMRSRLFQAGIPAYPSVKRAVRALMHLYRYHSFRLVTR
jgi:acyl-CoA synthetase (NDP forming)